MSVIDDFERWLKDSGKSPRTVREYSRDVERFLDFIGKPPELVTGLDVSNWYQYMRSISYGARGPRRSRREIGYSERSLNRYGWALRKFFQVLGRPEMVPQVPTPAYESENPKWLGQDVIFDIIENARPKARSIISAGYDWALRVKEVTLIRREWFRGDEVTVYRLKRKGWPRKMNLPVSDWCKPEIYEQLQRLRPEDKMLFPIVPMTATYHWRASAKRVGVDPYKYSFQCLRHSRITQRAIEMIEDEGKVDEVRLAMFAGHIKTSTTLLYTHLATEYLTRRKRR